MKELPKEKHPCIDHGQKGDSFGYGRSTYKKRQIGSHVFALIQASGEEPNGRFALHSFDNARCINPAHLRWGTPKENVLDMHARGRAVRAGAPGERNGNAKLTVKQVMEIRDIYAAGGTFQSTLASQYKISKSQMSRIIRGMKWITVKRGPSI